MAAVTYPEPMPKWSDDPNAYNKAWIKRKRKSDPEFARRQAESSRAWQKANPLRAALIQYRNAARRRGFEWTLPDDLFERVVTSNCHYCGVAPTAPAINGIDRVDNTQGYTPENVATACAQCNYAKRNSTLAEFTAWVDRIADFRRAES